MTTSAESQVRGSLSVVILTHDAYFHWLPGLLRAVYRQRDAFDELILVCNSARGCPAVARAYPGLKIVLGAFPSPNDARNAGLARVRSEWACYVDGDNVPAAGYFGAMRALARAAPANVAVLYPDIARVRPDGWAKYLRMPEWDYWTCREESMVDTSSAWRTTALRAAGGWFTPAACLQDYATMLRLTRHGWRGQKARGLLAPLRDHAHNISNGRRTPSDVMWACRRFAIVTLFAGRRHCLAPLMHWYATECFPPDSHWVWVDDSANPAFHAMLQRHSEALSARARSVRLVKADPAPRVPATFREIHDRVAGLYNRAFGLVTADTYLTVEDDVIARRGAMRTLVSTLLPSSRWGGVGAIYPSRSSPRRTHMSASLNKERWEKCPIDAFPRTVVEAGLVAGGFTAWSGGAIHACLPLHTSTGPTGDARGWDGTLCCQLVSHGYRVGIDGRVHCEHLFHSA